ncbi:hypothetical protein BKA66DRAFT_439514 [Pyrenochaeta sp. MPI-SDFR-AT-0127]|nr:hypothetical protein BKA66DRAFT_439514 [Pyrenochaeta sp. MPI-SDFR-AT-0127]
MPSHNNANQHFRLLQSRLQWSTPPSVDTRFSDFQTFDYFLEIVFCTSRKPALVAVNNRVTGTMSDQTQMSDAKQRVQKALQEFPTSRTVQMKDKTFYEHILLQVRAILAKKESQSTSERELHHLRTDIANLDEVVDIKTDYIAFLDQHMRAFQDGLAKGAKKREGKAMHWEAGDLIRYIDQDEDAYLERTGTFKRKLDYAVSLVNPAWVEAFGEMYVEGKTENQEELTEESAQFVTDTAKQGIENEGKGVEKGLESDQNIGEKKTGGRLKGKARKEAKLAAAAKK